jgi:hypothetical protein
MIPRLVLAAAVAAAAAMPAEAALVVSRQATSNVTCASGACTATAADAVLNIKDVRTLLAGGDLVIKSGSVAMDIAFDATLNWARSHRLTLDSYRSIVVSRPITSQGTGGVTLTTNDGGSGGDYSFADKGKIAFLDTTSSLVINARDFALVRDIATLAADIQATPAGAYALAQGYNATTDGAYQNAAIATPLTGIFEGLGHGVTNLTVDGARRNLQTGFFAEIASNATVRDLRMTNETVDGYARVGGIAAVNAGTLQAVSVQGTVTGHHGNNETGGVVGFNQGTIIGAASSAGVGATAAGNVGGLVGVNEGAIALSSASGNVSSAIGSGVGGLVGLNQVDGAILASFATGTVTAGDTLKTGDEYVGGLVGLSLGRIVESYARGAVAGGSGFSGQDNTYSVFAGGLAGEVEGGTINQAYSTGTVSVGDEDAFAGGVIGFDNPGGTGLTAVYWDVKTSGTLAACGAGNCAGASGLTSGQFKAGLPNGFDPAIWGGGGGVNDGYPYLLANPPQ